MCNSVWFGAILEVCRSLARPMQQGCVHHRNRTLEAGCNGVQPHEGLEGSRNYSPMSSSTTSDAVQRAVSRDAAGMLLVALVDGER